MNKLLAQRVQLMQQLEQSRGKGSLADFKAMAASIDALTGNIEIAEAAVKRLNDAKVDNLRNSLEESAAGLKAMHDALAGGVSQSAAAEQMKNAAELAELYKKLGSGISPEVVKALTDHLQANEAMEHSNKLLEEGARLRESILSPQQKLNEKVAHYAALLKAGAIDQATYAAAVEKAQESIQKALGETIDSRVFDAANFNFGAFAQLGAPGQGLFGGGAGGGPGRPGKQPPGAPPVPPALANGPTSTEALLQQILDAVTGGRIANDVHTCSERQRTGSIGDDTGTAHTTTLAAHS